MRPLIYRVLENPSVYNLSQVLLAPGARRRLGEHYRETFRDSAGTILDVGCGPRLTSPQPSVGVVVGIDLNPAYVAEYAGPSSLEPNIERSPALNRLGLVASADALPFADEAFDESRSIGLFHHLTAEQVGRTVLEMRRCTRVGGRVVILDAVLPRNPLLRPFAWVLRKADRGEWVRRQEDLVSLVHGAWPCDWSQFRFTYSYNGLETLLLTVKKQ